MNPGIFYFYYYTPKRPPCNVGFLKLGQRFQACSLELHIRNVPVSQGTVLKLGTFYAKDRQFPAKFLSDISAKTNAIFAKFDVPSSLFPDSCTLSELCGFFLLLPDGSMIAATAPGISFDPKMLRFHTPSLSSPEPSDEVPAEPADEISDEPADKIPVEPANESPDVPTDKIPVEPADEIPVEPADQTSDEKTLNETVVTAETESTAAEVSAPVSTAANVRKINRRGLRVLPRKYWSIANNSFLMHGYHNYNHLLLIEKDGHYMVGVPGVYSTRESHAASLFGFPHFTAEYNQMLQLTDDEQNEYGAFGYWLCEIR